jgi:hypothetical protein
LTRHCDIALPAAAPGPGALKRETSARCRERAAADLLESAAMINANQRIRLETSAASWTVRANMLQRVEDSFARKVAKAASGDQPRPEPTKL